MLTEAELLLITAAVDGELTPSDVQRFDALVAANPHAARLARHLRDTAQRLRCLSKRRAPTELVAAVLARLPRTLAPARRRSRRPAWLPYAVAASLLLTVSASSFWFFSVRQHGHDVAVKSRPVPHAPQLPPVSHPPVAIAPERETPVARLPDELPFPREIHAAAPRPRDTAPMPRSHGGDLVGAGISERATPLQTVELKLPFLGRVEDFARDEIRTRFAAEFAADPATRIDLFARNLPAALDILTAAVKKSGVTVATDAATLDRIAKKLPTAFAILVEGLTPTELASLLEEVAKQGAANPQPGLTSVHAFTAGPQEQKEWKELFGRDLGYFRSARAEGPSPARPISDGTLGKLKTVGKAGERAGLLLSYLPVQARLAPALSKEIKVFFDARGEKKPGTVPAFIVLRPAAN